MDKIDNLLKDIFTQATRGEIDIEGWKFYHRFNTKIQGKLIGNNTNNIVLNIPSYNDFKEELIDYLKIAKDFYGDESNSLYLTKEESLEKYITLFTIVNMPSFYLNNPIEYIRMSKEMIINNSIKPSEFKFGEFQGLDVFLKIETNSVKMETPYKMRVIFANKEGQFELPSILFSINEDTCYLMTIQNLIRDKQTNKLARKLDRYFRKLNANIKDDDIIKKVSPNALVSMIIFNSYLKSININNVEGYCYRPIRYWCDYYTGDSCLTNKEMINELHLETEKTQFNITNKFAYLFSRYNYHFPTSIMEYNPNLDKVSLSLGKNISNLDNLANQLDRVNIKEKVR